MSREPDVKRLAFAITLLTFSLSLVSETHSLLREAGAQKRTVPSLTASMTSQERPPPPPPPPPANAGSAEPNTPKQGSGTDLGSSLKSLSPAQEIQRLSQGQIPCARHSLLLGIGTMAAVSAVGLVAGRSIRSSLNWGVGSFMFVSLASWQTCRSAKTAETVRMRTVIDEHNRKRAGGREGAVPGVAAS